MDRLIKNQYAYRIGSLSLALRGSFALLFLLTKTVYFKMNSTVFPDASFCLFPFQIIEDPSVNLRSVSFPSTLTDHSVSSVQAFDLFHTLLAHGLRPQTSEANG